MADIEKKVRPGDPFSFPAPVYNAMIDTIRKVNETNISTGGFSTADKVNEIYLRGIGDTLDIGDIVAIGDPLATDPGTVPEDLEFLRQRLVFEQGTFSSEEDLFAVLAEPLNSGDIARAIIAGPVVTQVVVNNAEDMYVTLSASSGTYRLETIATGNNRILWQQATTGTTWAIVELGKSAVDEIQCRNDSGQTIPDNSAAEITGLIELNGILTYTVVKPTADNLNEVVIIPRSIVANDTGLCFFPGDVNKLALVTVTGSPATGDDIGTVSGAWTMAKDNTGFRCMGQLGGLARPRPFKASTVSGGNVISFGFTMTGQPEINLSSQSLPWAGASAWVNVNSVQMQYHAGFFWLYNIGVWTLTTDYTLSSTGSAKGFKIYIDLRNTNGAIKRSIAPLHYRDRYTNAGDRYESKDQAFATFDSNDSFLSYPINGIRIYAVSEGLFQSGTVDADFLLTQATASTGGTIAQGYQTP